MKISSIIITIGAIIVLGAVLAIIILGEGVSLHKETADEILAKASNLDNLSYTEISTIEGRTFEANIWILGKKTKRETTIGDQTTITIVDAEKKEYITYVQGDKIAVRTLMKSNKPPEKIPPGQVEIIPKVDVERLEDETVDKKSCLVLKYTQKTGVSTVWIWKDNGISIKTEIMALGRKTVKENINIKIGGVKDSDFELPAGVKIQEIETLEIPEAPEIPETETPQVE